MPDIVDLRELSDDLHRVANRLTTLLNEVPNGLSVQSDRVPIEAYEKDTGYDDNRDAWSGISQTHQFQQVGTPPQPETHAQRDARNFAAVEARQPELTKCPFCNKTGVGKRRRDGGVFYTCVDTATCGFTNREGQWRGTSWDHESWQRKREIAAGKINVGHRG